MIKSYFETYALKITGGSLPNSLTPSPFPSPTLVMLMVLWVSKGGGNRLPSGGIYACFKLTRTRTMIAGIN